MKYTIGIDEVKVKAKVMPLVTCSCSSHNGAAVVSLFSNNALTQVRLVLK